jgi:hypothetical protein
MDGHYVWHIKTLDDKGVWKGPGFYYRFEAAWNNYFESSSPRSFHIVDSS